MNTPHSATFSSLVACCIDTTRKGKGNWINGANIVFASEGKGHLTKKIGFFSQ